MATIANYTSTFNIGSRHGRDRMVVGHGRDRMVVVFTTV